LGLKADLPHQQMKCKPLWKVAVKTSPEAEEAVAELLSAILGLPASVYTDGRTGVSTVTVYLPRKLNSVRKVRAEISTGLKRIKRCGLRIASGSIVMAKVRREDWAESWKRHFKPIEIILENREDELCESPVSRRKSVSRATRLSEETGKSLLIKPSWSRHHVRKDQAVMVLDPGLSFGTGQHPTTAFCLSEIVRLQTRRFVAARHPCRTAPSFLDLGTGSGILAIAAAKLGYSPVLAIDSDSEAVRVARANARANHVLHKVDIRRGDVSKLPIRPRRRRHRYDLVCANLVSDLLIAARRRIAGRLNPTGTLVLAGILRPEFRKVHKAYKALGLRPISRRNDEEWCSGSFRFGAGRFFEQRLRKPV
jgi:ribosomal protein L11 methyltransferase